MKGNNSKISKEIKEYILSIVIAFIIALTFRSYVFARADVTGPSMQKTLFENDVIFVEKISLLTHNFERGDIIIFDSQNRQKDVYVKRIVAKEGETIEIKKDGHVYINDKLLEENYLTPGTITMGGYFLKSGDKFIVPLGTVFVMGDNRGDSTDGRDIGPVEYNRIKGHVIVRVYPLNKMTKF